MSWRRHLRMQLRVEQRIFWRNHSTVFFTFVLPLALLPVLALSDDPAGNVPFIAALAVLSTAFQGLAIQLAMHRDQGVLKTLMSSPLSPATFIAAKTLSVAIVVLLELGIVVAVGTMAFGAPVPHDMVLLALTVTVGVLAFAALGCAVASIIGSSEAAPAVTNALYLGMILIAALAARVDELPQLARSAAAALPLTSMSQPVRDAWTGTWSAASWWHVAALGAWGALGCAWAVRRFRWEPSGER